MTHELLQVWECSNFMYGGNENDNLATLRQSNWVIATMCTKKFDTALLPASERATYFYSAHAHLEMMRMQKLVISFGLEPHDWGWQRAKSQLVLIVHDG